MKKKKTEDNIHLDLLPTQFTVDLLNANADERLVAESAGRLGGLTAAQQIQTLSETVGLLLKVIETLTLGDITARRTVDAIRDQFITELAAEQIWRV